MAKTNSTFKFGKMNKIQLAGIIDPEARRIYKNAMVDAQASYVASKNRKFTELRSSNTPQTPKVAG
jgi:hypothetical protein